MCMVAFTGIWTAVKAQASSLTDAELFERTVNKWNINAAIKDKRNAQLPVGNHGDLAGKNFWEDYLSVVRETGTFPDWIVYSNEYRADLWMTNNQEKYLCAVPFENYCIIVKDKITDFTSEDRKKTYRPIILLCLPNYDIVFVNYLPGSECSEADDVPFFGLGEIEIGKIRKTELAQLAGVIRIKKTNSWCERQIPLERTRVELDDNQFLEIEEFKLLSKDEQSEICRPFGDPNDIATTMTIKCSETLGSQFCDKNFWITCGGQLYYPYTFLRQQANNDLRILLCFTKKIKIDDGNLEFHFLYPQNVIEDSIAFTPEQTLYF